MYNALYHGTSLVIAVFGQKLWIKWGHNPHFLYCGTYKNVATYVRCAWYESAKQHRSVGDALSKLTSFRLSLGFASGITEKLVS